MSEPNLVTTYRFNNHDYFIKMHVTKNILELIVTDKQTGEDWQCCYDAAYIENITQKTGNFKQFHIFTAMLKSGLLKTSQSVYLDLMTFDDLDALRNQRVRGPYSVYHATQTNNNRRYLILTYTVEFDRIHYPLPLEYCGPPDPKILQQNIAKLEHEILDLKDQLLRKGSNKQDSGAITTLEKKVEDLTEENLNLRNETIRLNNLLEKKTKNHSYIVMLQNAIKNLEESVMSERKSHHKLVEKLRKDKIILTKEVDRLKHSEKALICKMQSNDMPRSRNLKRGGSDPVSKEDSRSPSPRTKSESWNSPVPTLPKRLIHRKRSKSCSESESSDREFNLKSLPSRKPSKTKAQLSSRINTDSSRSSSGCRSPKIRPATVRSRQTSREHTPKRTQSKSTELDFAVLENRIVQLQCMLDNGFRVS